MKRRGLAVPLALITLLIFFILILVLSRAGSETYTQTALANYSAHTRFFSIAAVEEATTLIHEKLSDPTAVNTWKEELVKAIFEGKELEKNIKEELKILELLNSPNFKDPSDPGGFQGGDRVFDFAREKLLADSKVKLVDASVRFHNFKPIRFDSQNPSVYADPSRYYRDQLGIQPPLAPVGDYFGFCTIYIKAAFGVVERSLAITRDIKISNNEPVGRNYALFAFGTPGPNQSKADLNRPGKMIINAMGSGRIRMRGPYYVNAEGYPDGTGGTPEGISYPGGAWDDYSFIPSPRGITVQSGMLFSSSKISRPDKKNGNFGLSIGLGSTGGLSLVLSSDPGYKAQPEVQNYWAGSVPVGEQHFSITGFPNEPTFWRGLIYGQSAPTEKPRGDFQGMNDLKSDDEARIEGALIGNYNQINFTKRHFCISLGTVIEAFTAIKGGVGNIFGGSKSAPAVVPGNLVNELVPADVHAAQKSFRKFSHFAKSLCDSEAFDSYKTSEGLTPLGEIQFIKSMEDLLETSYSLLCVALQGLIPISDTLGNFSIPRMNATSDQGTADSQSGNTSQGATDSQSGGFNLNKLLGSDFAKGAGEIAKDLIQLCWNFYEVDKKGTVPYYYALHSPYSSKVDKLEAFVGILNDVMGSVQAKGAQKEQGGFGVLASSINNMQKTAENAALTQNKLSGQLSEEAGWIPDIMGVLPSNFKPMARTCSRHYETIGDHLKLTSGNPNSKDLYLDGNIWVEELVTKQELSYYGNAAIFAAFAPGSLLYLGGKDAKLKSLEPGRKEDHLNIFYVNTRNPLAGDGMLELDGKIIGNVFSFQGVKPIGNAEINGNLIVELINKANFGKGNNLIVNYNPDYLAAGKKMTQWFAVSVSPKISGMGNTLRGIKQGPGDDGVGVLVETIGE